MLYLFQEVYFPQWTAQVHEHVCIREQHVHIVET